MLHLLQERIQLCLGVREEEEEVTLTVKDYVNETTILVIGLSCSFEKDSGQLSE